MKKENVRPPVIHHPPVEHEEITFAHPSEEELASILDFYGIEWRYEPTTFPLRWDKEGNLQEAFSPDFYLVNQGLYVELTTLRPQLMRLKRRKICRLKALYPDVDIKLWDRSDFVRLLERFGMQESRPSLVGQQAVEEGNEE
ncbi:MAG: hypothetical protein U9R48_00210 [Chloroflexota bacterium]|nr:hypothetical protein [Chloroflexota bacterium]